ncbi:MAG: hypothetical protein C0599_12650 [Salinivirgaceae bacterium]|nr:MAG: hypothetical protein C0599_12650 [Salinivirgaceae bacterium]
MKKYLLISVFFLLILGSAKSQENMNNEQLKDNKEVALNLSRAIMSGDWEKVDHLISDDFKYEADGRPAIGKQEYIGFMKNVLSTAFTGMNMEFIHVVAEGNLVSINYTNKMTHVGEFFGISATDKRVIASGQFIREVKNGKVTAEWQTTNMAGLMQQLSTK